MRIIFIGCVEIGLNCLKQVLKDRHQVVAIFTLAKKYARNTSGFVDFTPIAKRNKIPLFKIKDINNDAAIRRIKKIDHHLIIVCGWQRLISGEILNIPSKGTVGFHSSLLPKYRGRAPVNWAIIRGEKKTGVTMFFCSPEADTGDIIAQKSFSIKLSDTCATIYEKSAKAICQLLHRYLPKIEKGAVKREKNKSGKFKFWPKRSPKDGRINWNRNALDIHNWIRALTHPYPGAFTYHRGEKYFVWGSKFNAKLKATYHKPGEIIRIITKNAKSVLLVATADRPLWIVSISKDKARLDNKFRQGESFD